VESPLENRLPARLAVPACLFVAACAATPPAIHVTIVHECTQQSRAEKPAVVTVLAERPPDPAPAEKPAAKQPPAETHPAIGHWEYEGAAGPEHWGALDPTWGACATGAKQSPIDLEEPRRHGRASPITFAYRPTAATITDNGHTLQVGFAPGSYIEIDRHRYDLVQFHVHSPSEHTVRGVHHVMELHLVHKDAAGKLAVVGVFFDDGAPSPALGYVWDHWPSERSHETSIGFYDPTDLLPEDRDVSRYDGSLTTPPCSEGVVWNVMRVGRTDSTAHLDGLREHYPMNARPVVERSAGKPAGRRRL
jgi:carbonic anhydrase